MSTTHLNDGSRPKDEEHAHAAVEITHAHDASGAPLIWVSGEIDLATSDRLAAAISAAATAGTRRLVLDLSGATFIDSTGVHALLGATELAPSVTVRAPSEAVRRVLEITGADQLLSIER